MSKYKWIALVLVTLGLGMLVYTNKPYKNTDEYLKRNHDDLNLYDEDDLSGLEILKEDLKNKKIILAGEHHNLAENSVLEMKILKYLQKEIGVNYLLIEAGYADAYFLNKYLESGDETILKEYFNIFKNQKYYTQERYNHYINIYEFNQTLPKNEQIKIVGVEMETKVTYHYLLDITKDLENLPDKLSTLMDRLKDFNYNSQQNHINILDVLNDVIKDIDDNEESYKSLFKENFEGLKIVINNLRNLSTSLTNSSDMGEYMNKRDSHTFKNFKEIDSKLENPVYFGQWGSFHVFQDTFYSSIDLCNANYFASLLNKYPKYKGQVLSINYGYYFDERNIAHSYSYIDEELFKEYINLKSRATIFRLNNRKSPFKENTINLFDTNAVDYKGKPITNYFQYLILIRNS